MDEQIKKVQKDIERSDKKKGKRDVKNLLRIVKKFEKKLAKCDKMKKGK